MTDSSRLGSAAEAFDYAESLLRGEHVRLRGMREDDLATLARWEADPGRTAVSMHQVRPPSEAAAKEQLAAWNGNRGDDGVGFVVETLAEPATLVGSAGLWGAKPKDRIAELGISLGREHLGKGYGTDAVRVLVGYAFREMGLHRVQLSVWPFNTGAVRAYEKVGFVEEGRLRSACWHDGEWYDQVLMGILEPEWAEAAGRAG